MTHFQTRLLLVAGLLAAAGLIWVPMAGSAGNIPSIASAPGEIDSAMSGTNSAVRRAGVSEAGEPMRNLHLCNAKSGTIAFSAG